jgi:opacity protein-like surface antigen
MKGEKIMRRSISFILAVAVSFGAIAPAAASAQPNRKWPPCSTATLAGSYGYYANGSVIPNSVGVPPGPFVSIGFARFDGGGAFVWTSNMMPGVEMQGSYTVNPDCTATAVYHFPDPMPSAVADIVIVDEGREFFVTTRPEEQSFTVAVFIYKKR